MASTTEIAKRYFGALSEHDLDTAVACWASGGAAIDETTKPKPIDPERAAGRNRHAVTRPRSNPPPPEAPAESEQTSDSENVTALATIPKPQRLPALAETGWRRRRALEERAETDTYEADAKTYHLRLAFILFIAAVLGCAVGYWSYRSLPAPLIPISVRSDDTGVALTWPADETRGAKYAAIKVDDGSLQPLSLQEKNSGTARVNPASHSSFKAELVVQHWMRDSRGIIRYLRGIPPSLTKPQQTGH